MRDPWADVRPGDRLPGLPAQPWNAILSRLRPDLGGDAADGFAPTGTEVLVANSTGAARDVYSVLALGPLNTNYAADPDGWKARDVFDGTTPDPSAAVAVLLEGLAAGAVGRARLAGRVACRVNLTHTAHRHARPGTSTAALQSGPGGPARIIATENNWAVGEQWAVVLLTPVAADAPFVRFRLTAALATTSEKADGCTIDGYWGGVAPGAPVTVYNLPASNGYIFHGDAGARGLATWDGPGGKWWVVQLECPADASGGGGGGGCTGYTGTIGD